MHHGIHRFLKTRSKKSQKGPGHECSVWNRSNLALKCSRYWNDQPWASECPDVKNYTWSLNPVWYRMLYSCTHISKVSIKGSLLSNGHKSVIHNDSRMSSYITDLNSCHRKHKETKCQRWERDLWPRVKAVRFKGRQLSITRHLQTLLAIQHYIPAHCINK